MATRLYLGFGTKGAAPYTPATYKGAWDDTGGAVTRLLSDIKDFRLSDPINDVQRAEATATSPYRVLMYRGVTFPMAAQTINGNVDVCIPIRSVSAAGDFHWYVHAYVTQGDSDSVRATLIDNYAEALGVNEWPGATTYKGLNAPVAVNVTVQAGDRLVFELGYIARNTVTTSYNGILYGGFNNAIGPMPDGTAGNTTLTYAPWIEISDTLESVEVKAAQLSVRTLSTGTPEANVARLAVLTLSANRVEDAFVAQMSVRTLSRRMGGGPNNKIFMGDAVGSGFAAVWME